MGTPADHVIRRSDALFLFAGDRSPQTIPQRGSAEQGAEPAADDPSAQPIIAATQGCKGDVLAKPIQRARCRYGQEIDIMGGSNRPFMGLPQRAEGTTGPITPELRLQVPVEASHRHRGVWDGGVEAVTAVKSTGK